MTERQDPLEADDEEEPNPSDGIVLVDARHEYTMWGDDQHVIAGFERGDDAWGIYDFIIGEWLEVVPSGQQDAAFERVVNDWLNDNFRIASIPTWLELSGLWRPAIRQLLTRRVAFEDAGIDRAIESTSSANFYQDGDIVAEWEKTVMLDSASTVAPLSADLVTQFFADAGEVTGGSAFESWLDGATLRWRDNGEVLSREEARALLRLCRYIAACCG